MPQTDASLFLIIEWVGVSIDSFLAFKFTLTTFLSDIGPLLTHVPPNRSKRQNSSRCRQRLERERTIESASEPIKPVVPGGEPITLDVARVK